MISGVHIFKILSNTGTSYNETPILLINFCSFNCLNKLILFVFKASF